MFNGACTVGVVNPEKVLVKIVESPEVRLGLKRGDILSENTGASQALRLQKRVVQEFSKEQSAFGFSYAVMAMPVKDEMNRLLGVFLP